MTQKQRLHVIVNSILAVIFGDTKAFTRFGLRIDVRPIPIECVSIFGTH